MYSVLNYPGLPPHGVSQPELDLLTDEQLATLHSVMIGEIRQQDLRQLTDFCGNDEAIAIMKEVVSVVYAPLVRFGNCVLRFVI